MLDRRKYTMRDPQQTQRSRSIRNRNRVAPRPAIGFALGKIQLLLHPWYTVETEQTLLIKHGIMLISRRPVPIRRIRRESLQSSRCAPLASRAGGLSGQE